MLLLNNCSLSIVQVPVKSLRFIDKRVST